MVENLTPQQMDSAPAEGKKPGLLSGLTSSSSGRIVMIAVAVGVLLVVVAITAVVFLQFKDASSASGDSAPPPASVPATSVAPVEEPPTPAKAVPDSAVFTFRDVFRRPVRKAEASVTTSPVSPGGAEPSTTPTISPNIDPDTLYLQDIVTVDDKSVAILAFEGKVYTAKKGDRLGSTPWKVLDVSSNSVTMLFGDEQIVLRVGQGQSSGK